MKRLFLLCLSGALVLGVAVAPAGAAPARHPGLPAKDARILSHAHHVRLSQLNAKQRANVRRAMANARRHLRVLESRKAQMATVSPIGYTLSFNDTFGDVGTTGSDCSRRDHRARLTSFCTLTEDDVYFDNSVGLFGQFDGYYLTGAFTTSDHLGISGGMTQYADTYWIGVFIVGGPDGTGWYVIGPAAYE